MFTVGQMARICSVSTKTLRHYEAIGLFQPARVDAENQYRYYSASQILPLRRILCLRELGLGLEVVRALVRSGALEDPAHLSDILQERAEGLRREIAEREHVLDRISGAVRDLTRTSGASLYINQPVTVKDLPAMQVAGMRRAVRPSEIGALLDDVRRRLPSRPTGPAICIYHNPEFDRDQVDVQALFPVADGGDQLLPPVRVAALIHEEPGHDIGMSYAALDAWVEQQGYALAGLPREVFVTMPQMFQADEGKLVIEIQYPI